MKQVIKKLSEGNDLTAEECRESVEEIMSGEVSPTLSAAFLTALRLKGETADEIFGAAQAMRNRVTQVRHNQPMVFDNCGTGGDGSGTFNISTASAFVIAACGVPVAKHGNRSVSSKCGSAEVLQELGVEINLTPEQIGHCIDTVGIGFLFAENLHPAMKAIAPIRRELGFRTIFNLLGPLTNPAFAGHQLIGVFDRRLVEKIAGVARKLGVQRVIVVHNLHGIDEITTTGDNYICFSENGTMNSSRIDPKKYGFAPCALADLKGGDATENAGIILSILRGDKGPMRDTVVLNSAVSLVVGEKAPDISEGIRIASKSIDSGAAMDTLTSFTALTRTFAHAG